MYCTVFVTWTEENYDGEVPVTWHYDDILKMHFSKLHLNKPCTDTCRKCDTYKIKIKNPGFTDDEKEALEEEYSLHVRKAMAGYDLPKKIMAE